MVPGQLDKSTKPEVFLGSDIVRKFVKTILTTTACNTRQEPKMTMTLAEKPVEMCTKPYLSFRGGSKTNQAENRWKKSDQAVGVKKYPIFKYINCFKIVSSNSRTGCWVTSVSLGERSTVLRAISCKDSTHPPPRKQRQRQYHNSLFFNPPYDLKQHYQSP